MRILVSAALATALAAPAFGGAAAPPLQEPVVTPPAPVAPASMAYDWTGPYAGVTLGVGRVTSNSGTPNQNGVGAGLHLGYNMDLGDWVAGGELELAPSGLLDLSAGGRDIGHAGRIKLRAGPKFGENGQTFAFGTIGAAQVRSSDAAGSYTDNGWLAGVGVSHAVQDNWVATGELLYHRFNNVAGTNTRVNATTASAGISYRF